MANVLIDYRTKRGLSQQELADKLGVSRQLISLIEIGARDIQPQRAVEWEPILGIPRDKLCDLFKRKPAAAGERGGRKVMA